MTVIPFQSTIAAEESTVKLAQYAARIQVCECVFWGVRDSCTDVPGCRDIWKKDQRDEIAYYLKEAQIEIEEELRFHIGQQWDTDERHAYKRPIKTLWGYVVAGGVRGETTISAGEAVDHTSDPAVIGPVATTVTDENEIKIFFDGTDVEIDPSSITISGGAVTIEVPRCRMVDPSLADNPDNGLDYNVIANFASTVDVKRVYNDTTTQATLIRRNCNHNCDDTQSSACVYVRQPKVGSVDVPYSTSSELCGCLPEFVDLNYYSGVDMTRQMQDAIIRLAHSKMPRDPCACDPVREFWRRDRHIPDVITRERANCRFGLADGAWIAWEFTQAMKLNRGATL